MKVSFCGDYTSSDGYSRVADTFVRMSRDSVDWSFSPFYLRKRMKNQIYQHSPITIHHNPAVYSNPTKHTKNVLYTLWETSKVCAIFLEHASHMDELWFPTISNQITYDAIDIPKRIVPYPFPVDEFVPHERKEQNRSFRFLFVGTWCSRKGVDILIEAFSNEFDVSDNVELWLKRGYFANSTDITLQELLKQYPSKRPIYDVRSHCEVMQTLYDQCDCLVLPSRGEGWGLPAIEAGLCGLDIIVSKNTALEEIWKPINPHFVECHPTKVGNACDNLPAVKKWYDPESIWWEPDVESLQQCLRSSYENPKSYNDKLKKENPGIEPLLKALSEK